MTHRALRALSALLLVAALGTACGGNGEFKGVDPAAHLSIPLPPTLGGLTVAEEIKATKKLEAEAKKKSYVSRANVYSLRRGKELKAVLQIIRLTPDARPDDVEFRKKIIAQIGGTSRAPEKIAGVLVYKARVNEQLISLWFVGHFMEVLIIREVKTDSGISADFDVNRVLNDALSLQPTRI